MFREDKYTHAHSMLGDDKYTHAHRGNPAETNPLGRDLVALQLFLVFLVKMTSYNKKIEKKIYLSYLLLMW